MIKTGYRKLRSFLSSWFGVKPVHCLPAKASACACPHEDRVAQAGPLSTVHSIKVKPGFTLIEMMVAVTLFAIVMMVGVGALLSLVEANKRAQAINSVMNNLNVAVESMARSVRVGTTYHCEESADPKTPAALATPRSCGASGGLLFAFESSEGNSSNPSDQVVYRINGTQIERSLQGGVNGSWAALTAPEVTIESLKFYVSGTTPGDALSPRVLIGIRGSAKVPKGSTNFHLQTSVVQRLLDI